MIQNGIPGKHGQSAMLESPQLKYMALGLQGI